MTISNYMPTNSNTHHLEFDFVRHLILSLVWSILVRLHNMLIISVGKTGAIKYSLNKKPLTGIYKVFVNCETFCK